MRFWLPVYSNFRFFFMNAKKHEIVGPGVPYVEILCPQNCFFVVFLTFYFLFS